jgi:SAM-dependent methyltransferase
MSGGSACGYEPIDRLVGGYRAAQVLFTAARLNLFAALEAGPVSGDELARRLRADPHAVRMLADALTALGLLKKAGGRYRNSALVRAFLLPAAPRSQHALLLHGARLYEQWAQLFDVVKTGRPAARRKVDPRLRGDARSFAEAMASSARLGARETAAALDLGGVRTMLDIGGGPGLYAIACARRQPGLQAVVFDNPRTLEVARANIARAGLAHRVTVRPGDAFRDDLGSGYDFILLSNLVHVYSDADNRRLVRRAAAALNPGGRVCIKDFLLNPGRVSPVKASLFAVNMLVNTAGGDCYTLAEMKAWLRAAGLRFAGALRLTPPSQLVLGRKRG